MISSIGGFDAASFAVSASLRRQQQPVAAPDNKPQTGKIGAQNAEDIFLDYMKKSPAERMQDQWLKAHGLTKEKLASMSPKEQEAVMKQMQDDIEESLKRQAENKPKLDILV